MKISYCSSTVCSQLATIFIFLSKFDLQGLEQQSFCLLSACLVLTSLALEMCLEKWFQFETATADSYSHIKLQPFPELTVCPASPYKVDVLRAHGILERRDIQFGASWISNDSDLRLRILFPSTSHHHILSGLISFTRVFCTKSRSWWRTSRLI